MIGDFNIARGPQPSDCFLIQALAELESDQCVLVSHDRTPMRLMRVSHRGSGQSVILITRRAKLTSSEGHRQLSDGFTLNPVLSVNALWLVRPQKFQLKISTAAVVFPVCANLRFRGWGGGERSPFACISNREAPRWSDLFSDYMNNRLRLRQAHHRQAQNFRPSRDGPATCDKHPGRGSRPSLQIASKSA